MLGWMNNAFYTAIGRTLTIRVPRWFIDTKLVSIHTEKQDMILTFKILSDKKFLD